MWTIDAEMLLILGVFFALFHGLQTGLQMPA